MTAIDGLKLLEESGRVHGDVKPDNMVFIGVDRSIMIDNATAAATGQPILYSTFEYRSPEGKNMIHATSSADVYALGQIFLDDLSPLQSYFPIFSGLNRSIHHATHVDSSSRPRLSEFQDQLRFALNSACKKKAFLMPHVHALEQRFSLKAPLVYPLVTDA